MEPTNALARQVARGLWTIPEHLVDTWIGYANNVKTDEETIKFKREISQLEAENEK